MDVVKYSINKPVSIAVAVIIIILFGFIGLYKLPVQLTPDVEEPQIEVKTIWVGSTPSEIEKDIIEKQEDALKSLHGLKKMESSSYNNMGTITLTFNAGINIEDALLRISNKLNEVPDYPKNAEKPVINTTGARASMIIWTMLKTKPDNKNPIDIYKSFFEDEVRQYIERVPGVGSLFVFGGTQKQLEIVIDPLKMARYNISIDEVISRITSSNKNISAGILGMGKKNYRIRTTSLFGSINDPLEVVLRDDGQNRIFLKDIAISRIGYETKTVSVMQNATAVIVIGVRKEKGANVIELTKKVRDVVNHLNKTILNDKGLYIDWVYDQVPYIQTAISLVKKNVLIGGILAIIILLLFLRSFSSTLTIAFAIPISAIGTFIFMWLLGRNLNVVSLAGISFAVGMLVDNSIVVLENIDRHRKLGKSPFQASYEGAKEVWGAVLASTLTTVSVFLPVIFIQEEAGQLFKDIAIAITFSILLSLFVSVCVIPAITNKLFNFKKSKINLDKSSAGNSRGNFFSKTIIGLSNFSLKNSFTRISTVLIFTVISIIIIYLLIPKAEYLPQGNRNLILNILLPPPGYSVEKRKEIGNYIFEQAKPYFKEDYKDAIPQIKNVFYVAAEEITICGAISVHETEAKKMIPLFSRIINSIPGLFGISLQAGIFESNIGGGRSIDVNIFGNDINKIIKSARTLFGTIKATIPNTQIRPVPSLEISYPEVNIIPDRAKTIANGLSEQEIGTYINILMDGQKIDEFKQKGKKEIDLVLRADAKDIKTPENIQDCLICNKFGNLIRIKDITDLKYSQAMTQINHLERSRVIKLEVTPPVDLPLEQAMNIITKDIIHNLRENGKLNDVTVSVGGNADKLTQTRKVLQWNFLLALVITYLLMSALFENFLYPLIILFSIPLAGAGGFIGLRLVDKFIAPQPLDILTMLGFIILVGTVVNNAILIVHQALNNVRFEGFSHKKAITESVRTRIRPIFMSAATSIFGLFPLVISTGSGSELYRGLGSVLLGGLALSTILTLFVIPALLGFFINGEKPRK
ncbi:efflux RND transporter permease subunit [bacterium]|nr:efflux RND transporter permease subunit [bacterium]